MANMLEGGGKMPILPPEALQAMLQQHPHTMQLRPVLLCVFKQMANMLEGGGKTPILPPEELQAMGFKLVAYPLSLLGVSIRAMERALAELKAGQVPDVRDTGTFVDMQMAVGFPVGVTLEGFVGRFCGKVLWEGFVGRFYGFWLPSMYKIESTHPSSPPRMCMCVVPARRSVHVSICLVPWCHAWCLSLLLPMRLEYVCAFLLTSCF